MCWYRWTPALLLMAFVAVRPTASNAQPPAAPNSPAIGVAASTRPNAEGIVGEENAKTLSPGSELHTNETVRTGSVGRADLVFIDNTNLTVGAGSQVLLDKFVYDPTGSSGKVVLSATRGVFRFVTGSQVHRAYSIKTPYGTLGVRGTEVEMKIQPAGLYVKGKDECVATFTLRRGAGFHFTDNHGLTHEISEVGHCGCITRSGHWRDLGTACPRLFAEASTPIIPTPPPSGGGPNSPNLPPTSEPPECHCSLPP